MSARGGAAKGGMGRGGEGAGTAAAGLFRCPAVTPALLVSVSFSWSGGGGPVSMSCGGSRYKPPENLARAGREARGWEERIPKLYWRGTVPGDGGM